MELELELELSQKLALYPLLWPKTSPGESKNAPQNVFFRFFVKRSIKALGKICQTPPKKSGKKTFFFSDLQELKV